MPELLKNLVNRQVVEGFASAIRSEYPALDAEGFTARVCDDTWESRELKQRMRHITLTLRDFLPSDYRAALEILRRAAPRMEGWSFAAMVFPDFVEVYGLDDWEASLPALEQFTQQSSAEFAVRPFILRDPVRMMQQMNTWAHHENHHVRRLASEGCRPRLPWAMALPIFKQDPSPILPILETLKNDESEYVRRSVANNLNDISKDHPPVVIDIARRWQQDESPDMQKLIHHALRTLIKAGNPDALALIGANHHELNIQVREMRISPETVVFGGDLTFSFTIEALGSEPQNLVIDYVVHFKKANGSLAPKVFKLAKRTLTPGETVTLTRKHAFRPITTRQYYAGGHAIELKINGQLFERRKFELII